MMTVHDPEPLAYVNQTGQGGQCTSRNRSLDNINLIHTDHFIEYLCPMLNMQIVQLTLRYGQFSKNIN
mgnify:FL=1